MLLQKQPFVATIQFKVHCTNRTKNATKRKKFFYYKRLNRSTSKYEVRRPTKKKGNDGKDKEKRS